MLENDFLILENDFLILENEFLILENKHEFTTVAPRSSEH